MRPPQCASASGVHPHCLFKVDVGVQVVVGIGVLSSDAAVAGKAQNGGADGAPLRLSHRDGEGIQGKDVGAGHGVQWCELNLVWAQTAPESTLQPIRNAYQSKG